MSQIGSTLHGVNLATTFSKDFATGRSAQVGRGERTPFASGSAKFSGAEALRIKLGTVGRPEARATQITNKAVKTASRALGEMFGSLVKGNLEVAGKWHTQAQDNLKPMLKESSTGKQTTAEETRLKVIGARMEMHLQKMTTADLRKVASQVNKAPDEAFSGDRGMLKTAVEKELLTRVNTETGRIANELSANTDNKAWLSSEFTTGVQNLVDTYASLKQIKGEPVETLGLASKARAAFMNKLSPENLEKVARNLGDDTLVRITAAASNAASMSEVLKNELETRAYDKQEQIVSVLGRFGSSDDQGKVDVLKDASSKLAELMTFAESIDKEVGGMNLKRMMSAGAQGLMEGFYTNLGGSPELVADMSTAQLEEMISMGELVGVNFTELKGAAADFVKQVKGIGEARFVEGYAALQELGSKYKQELFKSPLDLNKMMDIYVEFGKKSVALYDNNRLIDRSVESTNDNPEYASVNYPSRLMDHMIHSTISDGLAQGRDFLFPDRNGAPSVLELDFQRQDLALHAQVLKDAPLGDLNNLRQQIAIRYGKNLNNQVIKSNLNFIDTILFERKSEVANKLLANHATEGIMVMGGMLAIGQRVKMSGSMLEVLAFQGLAGISSAFNAIDNINETDIHKVTLNQPLSEHAEDYQQIRLDAMASVRNAGKTSITGDKLIEFSPHYKEFAQQFTPAS